MWKIRVTKQMLESQINRNVARMEIEGLKRADLGRLEVPLTWISMKLLVERLDAMINATG